MILPILVFTAIICDAQVIHLTARIEKKLNDDVMKYLKTMEVFCNEDNNKEVIRCFSTPRSTKYYFPDVGKELEFQAIAYIMKQTECSNEHNKLIGIVAGLALMKTCKEALNIHFAEDTIEAKISNTQYDRCVGGKCETVAGSPTLAKTNWKALLTPKAAAGLSKALAIATEHTPGSECKKAYSCLSCNSGRVCAPTKGGKKLYEVARFDCTDVFPYCNYASGSCAFSPDAACFDLPQHSKTENFLCMRDGYFPDPLSCGRFFSCRNKIAYEHFCPYYPTPYYHPGLKFCVASKEFCADMTSSHNCIRKENHGRKVPIVFTPNYFLVCGVNNNVLAVDRCVGAYVFDPVALKCVFVCPYEGLFTNDKDCAKYIKCTSQPQGGFIRTDKQCPDGLAFSESEFKCVERNLVANCRKPYPDLFDK